MQPNVILIALNKFRTFNLILFLLYVTEMKTGIIHGSEAKEVDNLNAFNYSEMVKATSEIVNIKLNQKIKLGENCEKCTRAQRSIDRILHRQKRYLLFPAGSYIVVTGSVAKPIIFNTPRGYNYLGEVDFFYALPDKIIRPHHHTTTTTTEAPPPPPEMFDHSHYDEHDHFPTGWDHDQPGEVFMPPGGWQNDIFKNIDGTENSLMDMAAPANLSRRFWNEDLVNRNSYRNLRPPSYEALSKRRVDYFKSGPPVHLPYRGRRSTESKKPEKKFKLEDDSDWVHYKSHVDRRDLYKHIESIFEFKGIQIRTCILRAICEAKHFLLPKGKSLFHDMFRILFTIPTRNELKDEYSNAVRSHDDSDNCWKLYENECPISILELMLKSQKIS